MFVDVMHQEECNFTYVVLTLSFLNYSLMKKHQVQIGNLLQKIGLHDSEILVS